MATAEDRKELSAIRLRKKQLVQSRFKRSRRVIVVSKQTLPVAMVPIGDGDRKVEVMLLADAING